MRLARLIGPELELLLKENPAEVRELLDEIHPQDIADVIAELDDLKAVRLIMELPPEYAGQVFARIDEDRREDLAEQLGMEPTARIAVEMDVDDLADFVGDLPPNMSAEFRREVERVDPEVAEELHELERWPERSAGGLMTTEYWSVHVGGTIATALEEIRANVHEAEVIDTVHVLDGDSKLVGLLKLPDLVINPPDRALRDVLRHNVITVPPELDQAEVARTLAKYDLSSLPVVDAHGVMLGLITPDDVLDVMAEEHDEDLQQMGAVRPLDDAYFNLTTMGFVKKRAPWLLVLFVGGFLTTTAMATFDAVLRSVAVLSVYVPLLISAGGNSGSQSSTLIIRGLATGDIRPADWARVLVRELAQGLLLGGMLSLVGVVRVFSMGHGPAMALLVALTVLAIVLMGCVVGAMMPLVLTRLGVDPATASTPFIASLVDVLGIVIYLSLAQLVLAELGQAMAWAAGPLAPSAALSLK